MRKLGKIPKSKDASLETKAEATHTLVCRSWTGKKANRKPLIPLKHGVGGLLDEYPRPPEQIKPKISRETSMTKLKLSYFRHIKRRQALWRRQ